MRLFPCVRFTDGPLRGQTELIACGVGTAAAWSLPLDDTAKQRRFGRMGGRTARAERKWRRGGGGVQRRSERAGCADSRQGAHRQTLPAYRGMRCRRHPRAQTHGPGPNTAWRPKWTLARVSNRGQDLRQSRGQVCARGTDGCAQRGKTALAAMAEGPASGRYRDLEGEGRGAAEK
ncbi:hypothetical protein ERJ75_001540900 [Trypanosoma vivax]|nr:hypothetical protein ERJ75_001540900 [Trypanosoma vivax]